MPKGIEVMLPALWFQGLGQQQTWSLPCNLSLEESCKLFANALTEAQKL